MGKIGKGVCEMSQHSWGVGWTNVDHTLDPSSYVQYLHTAGGLPGVQAYKRQIVGLMDIHEGDQVLDVGCGVGDDVRTMAQLVGPTGRVVGVDQSTQMIDEARQRAAGSDAPVQFEVADAHHLPFPDGTFDCCRGDRTFQHLDDPARALMEMLRTARSGAKVVIGEPDWETMIVNASSRAVTRKVLNFMCDTWRNGWMGRQLPGLMKGAGMVDVAVVPAVLASSDYALVAHLAQLRATAERVAEIGGITRTEAAMWLEDLERAGREGRFFGAIMIVIAAGRKP